MVSDMLLRIWRVIGCGGSVDSRIVRTNGSSRCVGVVGGGGRVGWQSASKRF